MILAAGSHVMETFVVSFVLVMARIGAFVSTAPMLGDRGTPRIVKIGVSVALSMFWFCCFGAAQNEFVAELVSRSNGAAYAIAIIKEMLIGASIGFAFDILLVPARVAGAYIGNDMGLSLATVIDPASESSSSVVGQLYFSLAMFTFIALNIDHAMLGTMHFSLLRWPLAMPGVPVPWSNMISETSSTTEMGLIIAAPISICIFITTAAVLFLMRFSPQLNLFNIGFPLRILAGLFTLLLFLPDTVRLFSLFFSRASQAIMNSILF